MENTVKIVMTPERIAQAIRDNNFYIPWPLSSTATYYYAASTGDIIDGKEYPRSAIFQFRNGRGRTGRVFYFDIIRQWELVPEGRVTVRYHNFDKPYVTEG